MKISLYPYNRWLVVLIVFFFVVLIAGLFVKDFLNMFWFRNDPEITQAQRTVFLWNIYIWPIVKWGSLVLILLLGIWYIGSLAVGQVRKNSVHTAKIGPNEVPVHYRHIKGGFLSGVLISLVGGDMLRALWPKRAIDIILKAQRYQEQYLDTHMPELGLPTSVPTFADLLRSNEITHGKPLILGFSQGQPQYRTLQNLKSLAIAGWQGSGKTLSTGYIVASSMLAYGIHAYIVDPHKHHPESLYALIKPLEPTGYITAVNPFDIAALVDELNAILDRRLNGQESNEPGILVVIDEMARLAKMNCFDVLVAFLERCTEETRKANITFIGGSHKWTARHFKGRADIRGCMNSMLIHKMKPSQANLLLEDAHDKKLVKQLQRPGDAILMTDYENPHVVSMPFCTREDMETVAEMVEGTHIHSQNNAPRGSDFDKIGERYDEFKSEISTSESITPEFLTTQQEASGMLKGEWQYWLAKKSGISVSMIQKFMQEERKLSPETAQKLASCLDLNPVRNH